MISRRSFIGAVMALPLVGKKLSVRMLKSDSRRWREATLHGGYEISKHGYADGLLAEINQLLKDGWQSEVAADWRSRAVVKSVDKFTTTCMSLIIGWPAVPALVDAHANLKIIISDEFQTGAYRKWFFDLGAAMASKFNALFFDYVKEYGRVEVTFLNGQEGPYSVGLEFQKNGDIWVRCYHDFAMVGIPKSPPLFHWVPMNEETKRILVGTEIFPIFD
jgi:hypothetical protein